MNTSVTGLGTTATFEITSPKKTPISVEGDPQKDNRSTYDLSTKLGSSGSGWDQTPYPDTENKHWMLGALTGNVTVTVTLSSGESFPVTVGPITIPARKNIFENKNYLDGTISYDKVSETVNLSLTKKKLPSGNSLQNVNPNLAYYFIQSGKPVMTDFVTGQRETAISLPVATLANHTGQTLEAYVKVHVDPTEVWYRVASVPVNSLLTP